MSRQRPKPVQHHAAPKKSSWPVRAKTGLAAALLIVVGSLGYWAWKPSQPAAPAESSQTAAAVVSPSPQSQTEATSSTQSQPSYRDLVGAWVRPDGGYILEIKSADDVSGKLEAGYFNPQPIHVGKAEATQDGRMVKIMVRLQDVNYPGSTYTLTYDPATDRLIGNYFQAIERVNFAVIFERKSRPSEQRHAIKRTSISARSTSR